MIITKGNNKQTIAIYYLLFFDEQQTKQDGSQLNFFSKEAINPLK
jgi:hypothetical protein